MRRQAPVLEQVWTVVDLIKWGSNFFREKGIDSPRLTIELMLCHILTVERIRLYMDFDRPLAKPELATLRSMVQRRVRHEPLQYILGRTHFYGLEFEVTPDVLIPRPETEMLVDRAIRFCKDRGAMSCLDIGTGSGCIAISIARHALNTSWTAIDIQSAASTIARRNADHLGVADRVHVVDASVFDTLPQGPFHLITMNPPYIPAADVIDLEPEVRDHEPHDALTDDGDGLKFYRRIANTFRDVLASDGLLLCEIGHGQSPHIVAIFEEAGGVVTVVNDLADIPRIVAVHL